MYELNFFFQITVQEILRRDALIVEIVNTKNFKEHPQYIIENNKFIELGNKSKVQG